MTDEGATAGREPHPMQPGKPTGTPVPGVPSVPRAPTWTRLSRRALVGGGASAGVAVAGLAAARLMSRNEGRPLAPSAALPPSTTRSSPAAAIAANGSDAAARAPFAVPDGMALVTSPRLPLFGVGPRDPERLLAGEVADWQAVGSAVSTPVEPLALAGLELAGTRPVRTYADYAALVAGLEEHRGGVAVVPLDDVDFRVNVLSVGGVDPLRDRPNEDEPTIRIGVVGDIVPGRNVHAHMVQYGDFTRPFHKVAAHLAAYHLAFANLEGNLSDTLPQPADPHSFSFVSSPAMIEGSKITGIDAVTLANNHSAWNTED